MNIFDELASEYDLWFEENKFVYLSELEAVKYFYDFSKKTLEVGIGTARFAVPLKIRFGLEPSISMIKLIPENENILTANAISEFIPFKENFFECALLVTSICFVDDPVKTLNEVFRILKPGGRIIIGIVDKESELGKIYLKNKDKSRFYKTAKFFSTDDIIYLLKKSNFSAIETVQTVFGEYKKIKEIQKFEKGYGKGNFVVISGRRNDN